MNLVILASGMGTRLKKKIPKSLISFKNKSLLFRIVENSDLFSKIIVVGGYKSHLIKNEIKKCRLKNIIFVQNKNYKNTNMVESFFKSYNEISSDVIISYSDILYNKSLLKKMIVFKKNHILLNSNWKKIWKLRMHEKNIFLDAENVLVNKSEITNIGTKIEKKMPKFQFMGLIRFNKKFLRKIKNFYFKLNNKKIDFTKFLNLLIENKIIKLKYQKTKSFWFEVDTLKDLAALRKYKIR